MFLGKRCNFPSFLSSSQFCSACSSDQKNLWPQGSFVIWEWDWYLPSLCYYCRDYLRYSRWSLHHGGGVRGDMENTWLVMVIITVSYSREPRQGGMWHSPENGPRGTPVFFMLPILPMGVLNQLQVGGIYTFLTSWQERFLRRLFKKLLRASFESILPWLTCRVSMKLEPVLLTLRKDAKKGPQFY